MFLGRLHAMARTHDILVQKEWTFASAQEVVDAEVASVDDKKAAYISVQGDAVTLNAAAAQNLALAVHELITNSLKYGSLSCEEGRVKLRWSVDEQGLRLSWEETNGPAPKIPEKKGFGSEILRVIFPAPQLAFPASGFQFNGTMPLYTNQSR